MTLDKFALLYAVKIRGNQKRSEERLMDRIKELEKDVAATQQILLDYIEERK